jgi:type IV secretion system protein TrbL
MKRLSEIVLRWLALYSACGYLLFAQANPSYNTTVPSSIMDQFRNQRINWAANVWVYANALFGLLAIIEFAWSAAVMLLEKSDLQSWTSALIRKMMWLGAFYAVLLYGNSWIPAIIDSFTAIGQNASGVVALSPGDIFAQGLQIAGALLGGASTSAFFINPGPSLALVFCALLIFISYVIITINFIVTMVESYILVSVGFVFLGFGGSRWTAPYVERFIGLAVSIGIKILLLYCLIAAGMNLGVNWIDEAQSVSASTRPLMTAFDVMGAAVIFMMLCWQIPKLFAGVLGGAPTLTGGDFAATVGAVASAGLAAGSALGGGVAMLAGGGMLASGPVGASAGAGSSLAPGASSTVAGVGAARVAGGGTAGVAPPSSPSGSAAGSSAGTRRQPDPPSRTVSSQTSAISVIGGQPLAGSGFENERAAKGFRPATAAVSSPDSMAPVEETGFEEAGSATAAGPNPGVSTVTPVHSGNSPVAAPARVSRWMEMASTAQRVQRVLTRAANQINAIRRRVPSDVAPATTPPRMPIDHHED